jgi:hypothetical protein
MLALSPAIGGIPRPYLHNRREELIFPFAAGTFLRVKGFCRGGPDPAGRLESAGGCLLGLLRIAMADEDVENTPDLSISPDKVCYIIAKARKFDAKDVVTDPNDSSKTRPTTRWSRCWKTTATIRWCKKSLPRSSP